MLGVHNLTVMSLEADTTRSPKGENWIPVIASLCPRKRKALALGLRFQIIRDLSVDPVANDNMGKREEVLESRTGQHESNTTSL